jgi:hypothetical protein
MPGCYLLIVEKISPGWHNRTKCFDGYDTVNKCLGVLRAKKWIRWRQQWCRCSAVVLPAPQQVLCIHLSMGSLPQTIPLFSLRTTWTILFFPPELWHAWSSKHSSSDITTSYYTVSHSIPPSLLLPLLPMCRTPRLNARLHSPFTAFILKMRTELYTKMLVQFQHMKWSNPRRYGTH